LQIGIGDSAAAERDRDTSRFRVLRDRASEEEINVLENIYWAFIMGQAIALVLEKMKEGGKF